MSTTKSGASEMARERARVLLKARKAHAVMTVHALPGCPCYVCGYRPEVCKCSLDKPDKSP